MKLVIESDEGEITIQPTASKTIGLYRVHSIDRSGETTHNSVWILSPINIRRGIENIRAKSFPEQEQNNDTRSL